MVAARTSRSSANGCFDLDLVELPRLHVVDEAAHARFVRNEGARMNAGGRLQDVVLEGLERFECKVWPDPGLRLDLSFDLVVREREHPAVRVMHQDNLFRAEEPLRDDER